MVPIIILIIIGTHIKLLGFKFKQDHAISEDFDFFEGEGGGRRWGEAEGPHF